MIENQTTARTTPYNFTSGATLAARLRELADRVEPVGDLATAALIVRFQFTNHGGGDDLRRVASVDALAAAFGESPVADSPDNTGVYRYGTDLGNPFTSTYTTLQSGVEERRAKLLAELAKLPPAEPARPNQDDHLADYGFNPTRPPAEPCLTVVGTGPECEACDGPASGVHSNHTLTEDAAAAASAAADLGPVPARAPVDLAEICRTLGEPSGPTDVAIREIPTAYPIHYAASGAIRAFAVEGHAPLVAYNFETQAWSAEPAPAAPVAVSPERVSMRRASELCRDLNDFPSPGAADAHLRSQPEFARVRNADEYGLIFDAELVDGSTITNSAVDGWTWSR